MGTSLKSVCLKLTSKKYEIHEKKIVEIITESQNGWSRKGPLEDIWSKTDAQEGPPRAD